MYTCMCVCLDRYMPQARLVLTHKSEHSTQVHMCTGFHGIRDSALWPGSVSSEGRRVSTWLAATLALFPLTQLQWQGLVLALLPPATSAICCCLCLHMEGGGGENSSNLICATLAFYSFSWFIHEQACTN